MNFFSPQLSIREVQIQHGARKALYFEFRDKFTEECSVSGSAAWTEFLRENQTVDFEFVWDCTHMTGFEISARKEWYRAMQGHKQRIKKVYVISDRIMIRSAAKVMLQFFGIDASIHRSSQELPEMIQL